MEDEGCGKAAHHKPVEGYQMKAEGWTPGGLRDFFKVDIRSSNSQLCEKVFKGSNSQLFKKFHAEHGGRQCWESGSRTGLGEESGKGG